MSHVPTALITGRFVQDETFASVELDKVITSTHGDDAEMYDDIEYALRDYFLIHGVNDNPPQVDQDGAFLVVVTAHVITSNTPDGTEYDVEFGITPVTSFLDLLPMRNALNTIPCVMCRNELDVESPDLIRDEDDHVWCRPCHDTESDTGEVY